MTSVLGGTVTLLFTDIEGSTRLLHELGDRYAEVLTEHRRILRDAVKEHGGREVDTQGDSFFVAFSDPRAAAAAAAKSQTGFAAQRWPDGIEVRVRMGIHTGEPLLVDQHYVGIDVHRAARIAAAAHGGQVLVSRRTCELLGDGAGSSVTLRELGPHPLKDLPEPEHLFQLIVEGLPSSFPPPRASKDAPASAGLPDYSLPPADVPCPYKGLEPFEREDRDLFFGREHLVDELVARLEKHAFLAVVGDSGSGKSSLVRAGVVSELERRVQGARAVILTPGERPLKQLETPLASEPAPDGILVVDQFEEVFTLCRDEEERRQFIEAVLDACSSGARVVLVLRADFYGHCALYPRLATALEDHQALIGPMSEEELRRVIERPAEQAGLLLEPGFVEGILRDVVGEPGALPLLSHTLLETWKRRSGRMLTLIGYLQSGGVRGAIAKTAETVFHEGLTTEQQALARNIFLRLTELGEGTEDTRRRVHLGELILRAEQATEVENVVAVLVEARLLTAGAGTVEVAHEALIRHWPTLRDWLDEDREGRLIHRRLTEAAQEWEALGRDSGALYRGGRLIGAGEWAEQHDAELNELELEYVRAGFRQEAAERAAEAAQQAREAALERRSLRRMRALVLVLAAAALVATGLTIFAFRQSGHAKREARIATGRELTAASAANLDVDPERSILLALRAIETYGLNPARVPRDAVEALHRAVEADRLRLTLRDPATKYVAFSPDGRLVATAAAGSFHGSEATAKASSQAIVWDSRTGRKIRSFPGQKGEVGSVAFSPDGSRLFIDIGGFGTTAWSVQTGKRLFVLPDREFLFGLALSADGKNLATTSAEGTLKIWDLHARNVARQIRAPILLCAVAFSPSGKNIVASSCGPGNAASIWNVATGRRLLTVHGPRFDSLIAVAYSPDGGKIVTGGIDGKGRIYDARSGRLVTTLEGHTGWIFWVAFSPDGRRVATGSSDGTARVWDAATGQQLLVLAGHSQPVNDVAFSPDGRRLATGSIDGTARVWDVSPGGGHDALTLAAQGDAPLEGALTVTYSPDGRWLVTGGGGAVHAKLWDAKTGSQLRQLPAPPSTGDATFSPDGRRIVFTGDGPAALIDDANSGKTLRELRGDSTLFVAGSAWSPDGRLIALARADGRVTIWDARTGRLRRTLVHSTGPSNDPSSTVYRVGFSPDGQKLVSAAWAGTLKFWDVASGRLLNTIHASDNQLNAAVFSPDGRRLLTGSSDGTAKIWALPSGRPLFTLAGHAGAVSDAAFSPDGKLVATAGDDTTVRLWNAGTGQELLTLTGARFALRRVTFSPDGRRLAAASGDGNVRIYVLPLNELMSVARSRLTRTWTQAECRRYLPGGTCPGKP